MKNIQKLGFIAVLFVFFLMTSIWVFTRPSPPYPGNSAPPLEIISLKGTQYTLDSFKGRWIFLNFWTTWCPPCREEFPDIIQAWKTHKKSGHWTFLIVNAAEPEGDVRAFLKEMGETLNRDPETLPIFLDTKNYASRRYQVFKYPETFIINPDGVIVMRILGPRKWTSHQWLQVFTQFNFLSLPPGGLI